MARSPNNPPRRSAPHTRLPLRQAIALGLLQGPTELLPVSSSGHTTLIPWLAQWDYARLQPELRKSFEVALHAGAAAALLVDLSRREYKDARVGSRKVMVLRARAPSRVRARAAPSFFKPPHLGLVVISFLPPALAGYLLEEKIERHLGTPGTIAAGLLAGALGMGAADAHSGPGRRSLASATMRDGLVLGIAQALALAPGVSRNGSTLAAARLRGFSREDAQTLSWEIALPVIIGASALKSARACQRGIPAGVGKALAAGTFASFGSTLLSARCLGDTRTRRRSLLPYAVYRGLLALLVITRLRRNSTEHAARNH